MKNFIKRMLQRFGRDDRGSTMVELVIVMPVLSLWFAASFTYFDSFKTYSSSQKASYAISDIISRYTEIGNAQVLDLNNIFDAIMNTSSGQTSIRVTSVTEYNGSYKIDWSLVTHTAQAYTTLADLPTAEIPILAQAETVIIVETYYPFKPIFPNVGITSKNYVNRFVVSPRFAGQLAFVAGS
jgi:Flp pilus assembly protein TadG